MSFGSIRYVLYEWLSKLLSELLYSYGLLCGHYNNPRRGEMWSILHTSVLGTKNKKENG